MKILCLGTALWGWGVSENKAFELLDLFYQSGNRYIDIAYNYPLNGDEKKHLMAVKYLSSWVMKNNVRDLKIIYKIGSVLNCYTSKNDLSIKNLSKQVHEAIESFHASNIYSVMIHWDNTEVEYIKGHYAEILNLCSANDILFGLSGVNPSSYKAALTEEEKVVVEAKYNFLFNGIEKYKHIFKKKCICFAYGISMGGVKFDKSEYREDSYVNLTKNQEYHDETLSKKNIKIVKEYQQAFPLANSMYQLGIAFCENSREIEGYIVAPRNISQLIDILEFRKNLVN